MINDIAPRGRATLPEKLKVEVFNRLRRGAERSSRIESAPGCGREEEKNS
jgi:hypothetical protein